MLTEEERKYHRKWRKNNPEKCRIYWRKYRSKNPLRYSRSRNAGRTLLKGEFEKALKALEVDGVCEICGKGGERVIDHDHETKKFRGLLCRVCNAALGSFKDSEELLLKALKYLRKYAS